MKHPLLGGAAALALALPALAVEPTFDTRLLSEHIKVLSSDAFERRWPAPRAETKTVAYIEKEFAGAGLKAGGDKLKSGKRSWTQAVPLAEFELKGEPATSVKAPGGSLDLRQGQEIAIRAAQTGQTHVAIKDAPVVFVGYGVKAPERTWDDFKGIDLHGKVALVLVNDPDYETAPNCKNGCDFGGKAMTYYGRWTYKYEEAARQGALGFIVIHETGPASYGWNTVKNSNTNAVFDIIRKDPKAAHAPLEAWIQRDPTVALFNAPRPAFQAQKNLSQTP